MEKFYLRSRTKEQLNKRNRSDMPVKRISSKSTSTYRRKVDYKIEINLTKEQLSELSKLFKGYNIQKPGWLRRHFTNNQRRRKQLNDVLEEAGCDNTACGTLVSSDGWFYALHVVWHLVNRESLCI